MIGLALHVALHICTDGGRNQLHDWPRYEKMRKAGIDTSKFFEKKSTYEPFPWGSAIFWIAVILFAVAKGC